MATTLVMDSPWRVPGRARARARLPVDRDRKSKLLAEFETAPNFRIAASVTFAAIDWDLQLCFNLNRLCMYRAHVESTKWPKHADIVIWSGFAAVLAMIALLKSGYAFMIFQE